MRRWLFLLLALLLTGTARAVPIQVEESFPHGVLYLLESLREEPHHSQQLRKVFLERHRLTPAEQRALLGYRGLLEREHTRSAETGLAMRLERLAADAASVDELVRRVEGELPAADAAAFRRAVLAFQEPYREAVWAPSRGDLDRQVAELREGFVRAEAPRRLDQVAHFMGSNWPADRPMRVLLTPIPKTPGVKILAYGHSNGDLQVAEAPTGAPQKHAPPVLFHEMCHALWNQRAGGLEFPPLARQQLDEALATAIGNAWFGKALTGALPEGAWYENAAIDGYARALYPLVAEALDGGGRFDADFARRAAAAFDEAFPEAWTMPAMVTAKLLLVAEEREDLALPAIQALGQAVQLRSCSAASPVASAEARRQFEGMAGGMVVFLVPPGLHAALADYLAAADREAVAARGERSLFARWTGDRWVVVSTAPTAEERRAALVAFLRQERLREGFLEAP